MGAGKADQRVYLLDARQDELSAALRDNQPHLGETGSATLYRPVYPEANADLRR